MENADVSVPAEGDRNSEAKETKTDESKVDGKAPETTAIPLWIYKNKYVNNYIYSRKNWLKLKN